jgi:para-aminobenzoate synthetase/4-amino-4-deoxychorismate lyase
MPGDEMTKYARLPAWVRATVAGKPDSVLLETSRFDASNFRSYLFADPVRVLIARGPDEIPRVFSGIEAALAEGYYVCGYFSYECGYHFEPTAGSMGKSQGLPLVWLGVYRLPLIFDHLQGRFEGEISSNLAGYDVIAENEHALYPGLGPGSLPLALEIAPEAYCANILRIKEYIAAGDSYQVNFTDRVRFQIQASPAEAFAALSAQQPVSYSVFLNLGEYQILSFSPELFFRVHDGRITTRPMKGTMPRGFDAEEDRRATLLLQKDEKNCSEHVMIVDLLRNDLGRICEMGSVEVEDIFTVERYETLLQMTSTISGTLRPGISYYEIFRGLFPSGSITGAPKVRTMQIIRELEMQPRGVYTGAIGFLSPDRSSVFNVAIRTLVAKDGSASLGVGGGVIADSDPMDEYRECLLKASFLTRVRHEFELIETMLWDGEFRLLRLHLRRLEASALYFSFDFERELVEARLRQLAASFVSGERYRVRLLLAWSGELTLTSQAFPVESSRGLIRLANHRSSSTDVFFRHKTTRRALYDQKYTEARAEGLDDVVFLNEKGEVTEGAISNVFVERSGKLLTPPLECGVLDGVYRRHLLETRDDAAERVLTVDDLRVADAIYLCNAIRGIYEVKLLDRL